MKFFLTFNLILFLYKIQSSNAESNLSCSINGTSVLFVPGALTTSFQQNDAKKKFSLLNAKLDYKNQRFDQLPLDTNGLYNDKMNYFVNTFETPVKKELAYVVLSKIEFAWDVFNFASTANSAINSMQKTRKKGLIGQSKVVNKNKTAEKQFLDDTFEKSLDLIESFAEARSVLNSVSLLHYGESLGKVLNNKTDLATIYTGDVKNKKAVKDVIRELLDQNKKIIVSAHGEGGQLVRNVFQELNSEIQYNTKLNNYVSVLATSPTTGNFHPKYRYLKNNLDNRIFGGAFVTSNFTFDNYRIDTSVATSQGRRNALVNIFNTGASDFVDDYLNEGKLGNFKYVTYDQYHNQNGEFEEITTPFKAYSDELVRSAEQLEDNCGPAVLYSSDFTNSGEMTTSYNVNGFTNSDRTISATVSRFIDSNRDGINDYVDYGETIYKWEVRSESYNVNEVISGEGKTLEFPIPYSGKYNVTVYLYKKSNNQIFNQATFDVVVPDIPPKIMSVAYYCNGNYDPSTQVTVLVDDPDTKSGSLWLQTYFQHDVGGEIVLQPNFREVKYTFQENGTQSAFLKFSGRGFDFYYKPFDSSEYVFLYNKMLPNDMYCFMTP
jgi:hypothetical protein